MLRFGILGVGNMGEAILRGVLKGGAITPERTIIFDVNQAKKNALATELGVSKANSIDDLMQHADLVLLAIKPTVCEQVFSSEYNHFSGKALVSIIAGWSRERLAESLPADTRILRVMPNTPAMAGEGMIVLEANDTLLAEEHAFAESLLASVGRLATVEPKLMDAVTAVSGSGPAYVYVFIEALADGGCRGGLPRALAYELAAQTVLGSAKMVLDTGIHPGELKDRVCSPGGTTIEAVAALEKDGFRSAVMDGVQACLLKSQQISKANK